MKISKALSDADKVLLIAAQLDGRLLCVPNSRSTTGGYYCVMYYDAFSDSEFFWYTYTQASALKLLRAGEQATTYADMIAVNPPTFIRKRND